MPRNKSGKTRRSGRGQLSKEERDRERQESRQLHTECPVCGESDTYWCGVCQNCNESEEPIITFK